VDSLLLNDNPTRTLDMATDMRNFDVINGHGGQPIFLWREGVTIEEAAIQQLINLSKMPFVYHHVAAMPDTHFGIGATVGSVFASMGAIIPAAVGVDIGCGMVAARLNLTLPDLGPEEPTLSTPDFVPIRSMVLKNIRAGIENRIPMGRTNNGGKGDRGAWDTVPEDIMVWWEAKLQRRLEGITAKHPELQKANHVNHLGTLGTGNHFIELQFDENMNIWLMLHSGSRGIGNKIGTYFTNRAKQLMERFFVQLPDKDLAFIPEGDPLYKDYTEALDWAQDYAYISRQLMLYRALAAVQDVLPHARLTGDIINTHHNYAAFEKHFGKTVLLTRKGAISAREGQLGIIPGSMGTRSYIVQGRGNALSFHSCSHGAGRSMSRTEAKRRFTLDDHAKAVSGVECRLDEGVIDETPMAYKDIDHVIEAERDLVSVVHTLKQLLCCKG